MKLALLCFLALAVPCVAQQVTGPASLPAFNVKAFGAKGDGTTNDTTAIAAAISAAAAAASPNNGQQVYLPSGIYQVTGVILPAFVRLSGDGIGITVLQMKANTAADVVTVPVSAYFMGAHDLTIDGNSGNGATGNCLTLNATGTSSGGNTNVATKQTTSAASYKFGTWQNLILSNCSNYGLNRGSNNFANFFDQIYAYNNGVYGIYDNGTDSLFTDVVAEHNGSAGIYLAGSNNKYQGGKSIWNGNTVTTFAAVYVTGSRNVITAIETQDNYTNGFYDGGNDNQFIGDQSDTNGYAQGNINASSGVASGFVLAGSNSLFEGCKVTSYKGLLGDSNYATQYPYTISVNAQSNIDITYDSTNSGPTPTNQANIIQTIGFPGGTGSLMTVYDDLLTVTSPVISGTTMRFGPQSVSGVGYCNFQNSGNPTNQEVFRCYNNSNQQVLQITPNSGIIQWTSAGATTVSGLGTCNSGVLGARRLVTDATLATPGSTAVGSGTYTISVQCIFNSTGSAYTWIID